MVTFGDTLKAIVLINSYIFGNFFKKIWLLFMSQLVTLASIVSALESDS